MEVFKMVLHRTVLMMTIATLLAQPAFGMSAANKGARLAKIAADIGVDSAKLGQFMSKNGFKPGRGGYFSPIAAKAAKQQFQAIVPVIRPIETALAHTAPVKTLIAPLEAVAKEAAVDELAPATVDAFSFHTATKVRMQALEFNVKNALSRCGERYASFGKEFVEYVKIGWEFFPTYAKVKNLNKQQVAKELAVFMKELALDTKEEVTKINKAFLTDMRSTEFGTKTSAQIAIAKSQVQNAILAVEAFGQAAIANAQAAYTKLTGELFEVATSNPGKTRGLFAAIVGATTAGCMGYEINEQSKARTAKLEQAAAIAQQQENARLAEIATNKELAAAAALARATEQAKLNEQVAREITEEARGLIASTTKPTWGAWAKSWFTTAKVNASGRIYSAEGKLSPAIAIGQVEISSAKAVEKGVGLWSLLTNNRVVNYFKKTKANDSPIAIS